MSADTSTARTSTSHTGAPAESTSRPRRDHRTTWRWVAAISIVAGPALVTVLRAVMPYWTDENVTESLAHMADSPGRLQALNLLSLFSFPFLVMGAVGAAFALRRRTPILATVGGGITFAAFTMGSYLGVGDVVAEVMLGGDYTQAQIADVVQGVMDHPTGLIGILFFVFGHLSGLIVLGIAMLRSGLVPWWAGAMVIVGQPIHVMSAVLIPNRALDVVLGWGMPTLGFAVLALAILRMSNDDWDLAPEPRN